MNANDQSLDFPLIYHLLQKYFDTLYPITPILFEVLWIWCRKTPFVRDTRGIDGFVCHFFSVILKDEDGIKAGKGNLGWKRISEHFLAGYLYGKSIRIDIKAEFYSNWH